MSGFTLIESCYIQLYWLENALKAQSHPLFSSLMGLSNELLCILVTQGAAKLPEVTVGYTKENLELEPGPHSCGADWAKRQIFFQSSNFDLWEFCSLLSYKEA